MKPILQVEDDLNDIFLLQHALKRAGAENPVQLVTDGQEAIDYLRGAGKFADRAQFPLPCLVLLDLNMPCVPGLDVLRWICQQGMSLVVLVLSTSGEEADIAAAYRLGANGFLIKPSQASKLAEMAKAIKDFWLTHATLPKEALAAPAESAVASARANPFTDKQMLPGNWAALSSRTMAIK
jgi:CheY-like chemotaxis protein